MAQTIPGPTAIGAILAVAIVLLPLLGLWLHARERARERESGRARAGAGVVRAGLLEMQNLLEPERKVEILREMEKKEDLLVSLDDEGEPDDPGGARGRP